MPPSSRPTKPLPARSSTRVTRSTRHAAAQTIQSLLAPDITTEQQCPPRGKSDGRHIPAELVNTIVAIIGARNDQPTSRSLDEGRQGLACQRSGPLVQTSRARRSLRSLQNHIRSRQDAVLGPPMGRAESEQVGEQDTECITRGREESEKDRALSMAQHLIIRPSHRRDPWAKWITEQVALPGGIFSAVKSLRFAEQTLDLTIRFSTSPQHYLLCPARHRERAIPVLEERSSTSTATQQARSMIGIVVHRMRDRRDWGRDTTLVESDLLAKLCQTYSTCCVHLDLGAMQTYRLLSFVRWCGVILPTGLHAVRARIAIAETAYRRRNDDRAPSILRKLQTMIWRIMSSDVTYENGRRVRGPTDFALLEVEGLGVTEEHVRYDGQIDIFTCNAGAIRASPSFLSSMQAVSVDDVDVGRIRLWDSTRSGDHGKSDSMTVDDIEAPLVRFIAPSLPPCLEPECRSGQACPDGKRVVHWIGPECYDLGKTVYKRNIVGTLD